MKCSAVLISLAVLVAACAQDPSARPLQAGESSPVVSSAAGPDTTMPANPISVPATTVVESEPDTTTSVTADPAAGASDARDDEIITGSFYPTGTPVPIVLPEGAIGPTEWISKDGGTLLADIVGARTYRLRTVASIAESAAGRPAVDYVYEVDVVEGATMDDLVISLRWVISDEPAKSAVVIEVVLIDGRQYRRDQGGEWFDNTGGPLFGLVAPPIPYAQLHDSSLWISAAEWLGNDEINDVPVGRYRWTTSENMRSIPTSDWGAVNELSIDAEGVVWQLLSEIYGTGQLLWSLDTVLYDVGATIEVEAPTIP